MRSMRIGLRCLVLAAGTLVPCGTADAGETSSLQQKLQSSWWTRRKEAAMQLALLGPSAQPATKALVEALDDPEPEVRTEVQKALVAIGPVNLEDFLEEARTDDDLTRAGLAVVLRGLAPAVEQINVAELGDLLKAFRREDPVLREALGGLLSKAPPKYAGRVFRAARWKDGGAYEIAARALGSMGEPVVPVVAKELGSPSEKRMRLALLALGHLGASAGPHHKALLTKASGGPADVRNAALISLGRLGVESALPTLEAALQDPDESVRASAGEAIVMLGAPALPRLLALLFERDGRHRAMTMEVLARIGEPALSMLERELEAAKPEQRPVLVAALVRVGVDGAATATSRRISQWLENAPVAERRALLRALTPARRGGPLLAAEAVGKLLEASEAVLRAEAIRTLGEARPANLAELAAPLLLRDPDPRVRLETAGACIAGSILPSQALKVVAVAASAKDRDSRRRAAEILGDSGKRGMEARQALEDLAGDTDPAVRLVALRAISSIFSDPSPLHLDRGRRLSALDKSVSTAVALGCDWLARHQDAVARQGNGGWDADGFGKHDGGATSGGGRSNFDVGVTGLALLALLSAGSSEWGDQARTRYSTNLREGFAYLLRLQKPDGCFGPTPPPAGITLHGVATLAVAEGWLVTRNPAYFEPLVAAVRYIEWARNPSLAWRYKPQFGENDTHVTAWMVMALDAAKQAGVPIDPGAARGALDWIDKMTDPDFGQVGYNMPGGTPSEPMRGRAGGPSVEPELDGLFEPSKSKCAPEKRQSMTAAAVWMRMSLGESFDESKMLKKGVDLILEQPPAWGRPQTDQYYWWIAARALNRAGGKPGLRWEKEVRQALLPNQETDGPSRGSWNPDGVWGAEGGRVYSTAMAVLTLTVPAAYPQAGQPARALSGLRTAVESNLKHTDKRVAAAAREALEHLNANGR